MALKNSSAEHKRQFEVVFDPEQEKKENSVLAPIRKKRVAAYARVSTEQDAQQSSYEAQIEYYTGYIQSKPEWEYVGVYADEGISGTSYKNRYGFNRMVEDAKAGKIDLILTKSISRFARNTVDSLTITRDLKAHGVEVRFEKENISSMDAQAELIFTIMSSIAQEESRSISENVRWGIQRSMEAGKVNLPWSHFLGYEKGPNGLPQIVEEEAKVVRDIYHWFLDGMTISQIAKKLTEMGVKSPAGKDNWYMGTVRSILSNEKYKGDARLMKTYITDFLTKKSKENKGERKQLYIHDSHDAIINPETFELVQKELERRCRRRGNYSDSPFASKLVCGHCGAFYGRKVWHSDRPDKKYVWICSKKYEGKDVCPTPKVEDEEIIKAYLIALNRIIKARGVYTAEYKERFLSIVGDNTELLKERDNLRVETQDLIQRAEQMVLQNAKKAQDQDLFMKNYNSLLDQINRNKATIQQLEENISANQARKKEIKLFLAILEDCPPEVKEFDVRNWHNLVESVKVMPDDKLVFCFRNGQEETVQLDEVRK